MILHVLQNLNIDCDYMVGAQLKGFDVMVRLTNDAQIIINPSYPEIGAKKD